MVTKRLYLLRNADIVGLYCLLGLALLSPIASNTILPSALDHANHTAFIVQAKQALDEGQFPLRVAPFQHELLRYPVFQFYSSTPYLIGGLIYKYITPANPWLALKVVYFGGLFFAGFFTFKFGESLGFSKPTSALMGIVYITSPYLLINIHPRGAFTEAFGQFVIPFLAFSSRRLIQRPEGTSYLCIALAWLLFGTSHIISFVYGTGFYIALITLLFLFRAISSQTAIVLLAAAIIGWLVAAYQWFPAATVGPLQIHLQFGNIFNSRWLTPLSMLLALSGTPPEPLGRPTTPFLYPAVGVPVLFAVAGLVYFYRRLGPEAPMVRAVMITFLVAFVCAWSPIDFWALLPEEVKIAQFSYRFLTYVAACGTALFGYFVTIHARHHSPISFLAGAVCLILFTQPYLPTMPRNSRSLESIIAAPDLGYGAGAYLYMGKLPSVETNYRGRYENRLPLVYGDGWLMTDTEMPLARDYIEHTTASLLVSGYADALAGPCRHLELMLDDVVVATDSISPGAFEWRVPATAFRSFSGPTGRMAFRSQCGFVPKEIDRTSGDSRRLWIHITALQFDNPTGTMGTVSDVRPHCHLTGSTTECVLTSASATTVQLPVLYYPSLLRVRVNGVPVSYQASTYGIYTLAQISLAPGRSDVLVSFAGSTVGNMLSLLGMIVVAILTYMFWKRAPVRFRK